MEHIYQGGQSRKCITTWGGGEAGPPIEVGLSNSLKLVVRLSVCPFVHPPKIPVGPKGHYVGKIAQLEISPP